MRGVYVNLIHKVKTLGNSSKYFSNEIQNQTDVFVVVLTHILKVAAHFKPGK